MGCTDGKSGLQRFQRPPQIDLRASIGNLSADLLSGKGPLRAPRVGGVGGKSFGLSATQGFLALLGEGWGRLLGEGWGRSLGANSEPGRKITDSKWSGLSSPMERAVISGSVEYKQQGSHCRLRPRLGGKSAVVGNICDLQHRKKHEY